MTSARERFRANTERQENGCLLSTAAIVSTGSGVFWPEKRKPVQAHRYAYMLVYGPIQEGLCVLHKCDTPLCVEVSHLFLGTHQDNMADMKRKGRARSPSRPGELCPTSILTTETVLQAKSLRDKGYSRRSIARELGISLWLSMSACSNWKHLETSARVLAGPGPDATP